MMRYTWLMVLMLFPATLLVAAESDGAPPLDRAMEPEVIITPRDQGRVKEYRVNGQLFMIEIVPTKGEPYFLVDMDGDGMLESRRNHLESDLVVPRWPLLRW